MSGVRTPSAYQWAEKTLMDAEQPASRQTGIRTTHIVSRGLTFKDVSSCTHSSGPANPCRASSATPFRSLLCAFQPSAWRSAEGVAHGHASATPRATICGSANAARRCCWKKPTPHAFSGWDGSVQLDVLANGTARPGSPAVPFPDCTLKYATLNVGPCADAT